MFNEIGRDSVQKPNAAVACITSVGYYCIALNYQWKLCKTYRTLVKIL